MPDEEQIQQVIREAMSALGTRRWAGKTDEQKLAHARMMVKARLKKLRERKRAKR